jgi:phage protein D
MAVRSPYYNVAVEGVDVTSWVSSVSVTEDDHEADSVVITVPDPRMIYADALFEGTTAVVDLGYTEPGEHATLIRATITKVELTYPDNGVPTLTLKGQDRTIEMALTEKNRRFSKGPVSRAIKTIAGENGFSSSVIQVKPDVQLSSQPLHQDSKTDLAFLQELAKNHHCKCFVELDERDEEVFYFIPERRIVGVRRPEKLVLSYRLGTESNLVSFSPTFDQSYIDRPKQSKDVGKNGKKIDTQVQPPIEVVMWKLDGVRMARASDADSTAIKRLYAAGSAKKLLLQQQLTKPLPMVGKVSADQAQLNADKDVLESRALGQSATGSTFGNIWLRAKSKVTITGTSERFDGEWYVSQVTHKIDTGGFKSDFKAIR